MNHIILALTLAVETEGLFLIGLTVAIALILRAAFGFGDGLLAVPLLTLLIELKEAVPLILFLSSTISVYPLWKERKHIQLDSLKRTSVAALLGIPLGVVLLGFANEQLMKGILGCLLIGLSIWKLNSAKDFRLQSKYWSYFFGALAGILGSAYALRGIVFSVYANLRGWGPGKFKSTINGFFISSGVLIPITYFGAGLITSRLMGLYLVMLPVAVISTVLGHGLTARVDPALFQKIVWVFLMLLGSVLLIRLTLTL